MDYLQTMQRAIDYMEEHMLEKISYEDAARQVYLSCYHFHRLFSMLTGITPNEYLRNRRLSMAGQELTLSGKKVIDIALKYGYESPESFAKAFSRFHGVTPNAARRPGMQLQSFNRLVIKIKLEGGTAMEYKIAEKNGLMLLATVRAFKNESIAEEKNTEISDFWTQCDKDGTFDLLRQRAKHPDLYGVCAPISKESGYFDYGIGMEYGGGDVPAGYRLWEVKPTLWAVFPCVGTDPSCIAVTWDRIFKEFLPGSDYNMLDDADFELYSQDHPSGCFCEIWIPVERKAQGV